MPPISGASLCLPHHHHPSSRILKHLALASASEHCFGLETLQAHISLSPSVSTTDIIQQAKCAERNQDEKAEMKLMRTTR